MTIAVSSSVIFALNVGAMIDEPASDARGVESPEAMDDVARLCLLFCSLGSSFDITRISALRLRDFLPNLLTCNTVASFATNIAPCLAIAICTLSCALPLSQGNARIFFAKASYSAKRAMRCFWREMTLWSMGGGGKVSTLRTLYVSNIAQICWRKRYALEFLEDVLELWQDIHNVRLRRFQSL